MKESLADQLGGIFGKKRFEGSETRVFHAATAENIKPGAILANNLTAEEGLVIKRGYKDRFKFFVVVGTDSADYIVGSLLINSDKAYGFNPAVKAAQVRLKAADYPDTLDKDCWLNCSTLFRVKKTKILSEAGFCEMLSEADWQKARLALINTPTISEDEKRDFGII